MSRIFLSALQPAQGKPTKPIVSTTIRTLTSALRSTPLPMSLSFARCETGLTGAPCPSPRPSPLGRGRIASRPGTGPDALVCPQTRAAWLPLPRGEGRGEGEQDVSQPDASDT